MKERNIQVKVGALVFVSVIIFLFFIYLLGDVRFKTGSVIYVDYQSSSDLKTGAPVKISGVTLGKVKDVKFYGGKNFPDVGRRVYVRVTISIDQEHLSCLHKDAKFYISTLGLLGEKYIEIEPGSLESPFISEGEIFEGVPPLRMEIMAMNINQILSDMAVFLNQNREELVKLLRNTNEIVLEVNELLRTNKDMVSSSLANVYLISENIIETTSALKRGVGEGIEIKEILANTEDLSIALKTDVLPSLKYVNSIMSKIDMLSGVYLDVGNEGKESIANITERVKIVLDQVKTIMAQINSGKGSVGAMVKDREMYDDLLEILKDLKRHPWKFFWKE